MAFGNSHADGKGQKNTFNLNHRYGLIINAKVVKLADGGTKGQKKDSY